MHTKFHLRILILSKQCRLVPKFIKNKIVTWFRLDPLLRFSYLSFQNGSLVIMLLQIFSWFWQWKNFENRLIFEKVKAFNKNCADFFFGGAPCMLSPASMSVTQVDHSKRLQLGLCNFSPSTGNRMWLICCRFLRSGPSYTHCCRALIFALARISCSLCGPCCRNR